MLKKEITIPHARRFYNKQIELASARNASWDRETIRGWHQANCDSFSRFFIDCIKIEVSYPGFVGKTASIEAGITYLMSVINLFDSEDVPASQPTLHESPSRSTFLPSKSEQEARKSVIERSEFYEHMCEAFSEDDVKELCFYLGVDFGDIDGSNRSAKIRELIMHCDREGRLFELRKLVRKRRPGLY